MHSGPTSDIEDHAHLGRLPVGIHYAHPSTTPPKRSRSKVKTKKRKPQHKIDRILGSKYGRI